MLSIAMINPLVVMFLWWLHYTKKGRSLLFYFKKWCNPWKYKVFNKKRGVRLGTTCLDKEIEKWEKYCMCFDSLYCHILYQTGSGCRIGESAPMPNIDYRPVQSSQTHFSLKIRVLSSNLCMLDKMISQKNPCQYQT